jgi:D-glycero-alpha-D-manno-heptose-7-phosphate kinase
MIRSKAPVRVSFGGGGTDVSPYPEERGGCVVSTTINKFVWSSLSLRKDQEIFMESYDYLKSLKFRSMDEVKYGDELDLIKAVIKKMNDTGRGVNIFARSDIPPKSGMGGSAAAFVSIIGLFNHLRKKKLNPYEIAELAYHLEREELKNKGGRQDQYASAFGGLNLIEFRGGDDVRVIPLRIKDAHYLELEKNLVLAYVSKRTESGDILSEQVASYIKKERDVVEALDRVKEIALEMEYALTSGDLTYFGELLHKGWEAKKKFNPMITTSYIDDLYKLARKYGAIGGKITGAGGGGHMIFYCEPNKEHIVKEKLHAAGAVPVDFSFDRDGLKTWEIDAG